MLPILGSRLGIGNPGGEGFALAAGFEKDDIKIASKQSVGDDDVVVDVVVVGFAALRYLAGARLIQTKQAKKTGAGLAAPRLESDRQSGNLTC